MKKMKIILVAMMCGLLFTGCTSKVDDATKLMEEGKYKEAADVYQKAIDKEKDVSEAYLGKGMAYFELEEYPAAKQALSDAIENGAEETPIIYNMIGICDMEQGNVDTALTSFEKGISLAGTSDEYASVVQEMEYNVVVCYENQRNWETAKTKIAEYISKYPKDESAQKEAQFLESR
ncbi:MAG: tetratricopeptide repeat protein [Hespellia sp.]|nr:tetratricopeptide repeat protein [Hespellia sp.]